MHLFRMRYIQFHGNIQAVACLSLLTHQHSLCYFLGYKTTQFLNHQDSQGRWPDTQIIISIILHFFFSTHLLDRGECFFNYLFIILIGLCEQTAILQVYLPAQDERNSKDITTNKLKQI